MPGKLMNIEKLACIASRSDKAQQGLDILDRRYTLVPAEQADVIVVLGGDGFMLNSMHRFQGTKLPIYGMNRGTVGFLMNEFREDDLIERINSSQPQQLFPLHMTATDIEGRVHEALAFNEVAMIRYSQQTANLRIVIDGKVRMEKMMSDGVLVCTPAGSTAYNLSVHGPVIPIGADIIGLTPISPFRPRRWRGALLPYSSVIEIINLDPEKRPLGASADSIEIRNTVKAVVRVQDADSVTALFDHGHSLEERIINEQFTS
jgi:NAD+ kinase